MILNKWFFFFIIVLMIGVLGTGYLIKLNSVPAISFFPLDEQSSFSKTNSDLQLNSDKKDDSYEITWSSGSASDKDMYLRQDASLLFDNGRLRGVHSKWVQDTAEIQIKENVIGKGNSLFQVITFHHGEIHTPKDQIKSIHHMTHANLYVIDSPKAPLEAFVSPKNVYQTRWKKLLDKTTKQQLLLHWNKLFTHFNIDNSSYLAVPLTNLYKYNKEPLPAMSQEQTNQIMGQLWEGLYKNYIIPAASTKKNERVSYIPIVLFDKKQHHLLVLFELNGKKQRLIQNYSK